jgi:PKD repeat protein
MLLAAALWHLPPAAATTVTLIALISQISLTAAIHYVDVNSDNAVAPYANWSTAANVIQDAIDVARPGDEIVVTNGVYKTGGRAVHPGMTNRIAVTKPLIVRSVNGPNVTVIRGHRAEVGHAVRCVYLTDGASLVGFRLTNGYALTSSPSATNLSNGGGVWCESTEANISNCAFVGNEGWEGGGVYRGTLSNCTFTANEAWEGGGARDAVLSRCIFTDNRASSGGGAAGGVLNHCMVLTNRADIGGGVVHAELNNCVLRGNNSLGNGNGVSYGGGAAYGVLNNCSITDNSASLGSGVGGGTCFSTLNNCTVTGNSAQQGGGVWGGDLNNCILYFNTAFKSSNYGGEFALTINNSCTWPLPPFGTNNIDLEPELASLSHISANSPCRGVGNLAYAGGVDIDGEPWANPPSIGCDEVSSGNDAGPLEVAFTASFTNVAKGFEVKFAAQINGNVQASRWEFGDGAVMSNRPYASHAWSAARNYRVVLRAYNSSNPGGMSATTIVHVVEGVHYVAATSTNPSAPFTSWATAANTIQDAIDVALPGDEVVVTNGVYETGGRAIYPGMTNRVAMTKPLTIRSVNGPEVTVIRGYQLPDTANGNGAVRCAISPMERRSAVSR